MSTRSLSDPGARIKELRLDREMTQRGLANKLGVDAITVSRWERGDKPPSDLNRVRLGRCFGVHPNEFLPTQAAA